MTEAPVTDRNPVHVEVNVIATSDDDAIATAVDFDDEGNEVNSMMEKEMYDMEKVRRNSVFQQEVIVS